MAPSLVVGRHISDAGSTSTSTSTMATTNKTGANPAASTVHAVGGTITSADATAAATLAAVHERTSSSGSSTPPLSLPPATVTSAAPIATVAATAAAAASAPANAGASSASTDSKGTDPTSEKHNHPHHVIFVVHGMGRQLEEFGNYERNVGHLVENTKMVLQNQFFEHKTDVHIIPIEWHAKLHSMVDQRMSLATLKTVPKVRLVMNDYFADILYYFNSHYGGEITKFIVDELNEAYSTFIAKHPGFNGKIAIYALSLGGVAMYDILTCQDDIDDENDSEARLPSAEDTDDKADVGNKKDAKDAPVTNEAQIESRRLRKENAYKYRAIMHKLKFRPHYLFTVGSPVGAVMVMRNLEWSYFHPPDDIIHHNLFHPFDPLGYRVEPLIDPVFSMIPPVTMTAYSPSQSLLPSISLPSLPSLSNLPIPESISSFWEQKVPAIPRSIPSLRTISQVAMSLKSASWRVNTTGANGGNSALKTDIATGATDNTDATGAVAGEEAVVAAAAESAESSTLGVNGSLHQGEPRHPHNQVSVEDDKEIMMSSDADATAGEAIVAAAAMAYFDQDPSNRAPSSAPSATTISSDPLEAASGSDSVRPRPGRRPSLGPRKISNRTDIDSDSPAEKKEKSAAASKKLKTTIEDELEDTENVKMTEPVDTQKEGSHANSSQPIEGDARAPKLDDVLNRHQAQEKARLEESSSSHLSGVNTRYHLSNSSSTWANREQTYPFPLLVQGRSTLVPYRIDHSLQETKVDQYTNEYLLGMRSHFKYWGNRDIAYHILKHLLHEPGKPLDDEQKVPDGPLDLQLHMPAPVKTPRGVREAAEAKAKQAATALQQQQQQQKGGPLATTNKQSQSHQHRHSSSVSASLSQRQEHDEEEVMLGRSSMQGYRFHDVDISMAAGDSSSGRRPVTTLFQNSPFNTSATTTTTSSSFSTAYNSEHGVSKTTKDSTTTTTTATTAGVAGGTAAATDLPAPPPPAALSFDEGIVHVPDLQRPARLHHRVSRPAGDQ